MKNIHLHFSIKCDDIKVLNVPQYYSLRVEKILEKINQHQDAPRYIPDERDILKVPRAWLCNVAYTVIGDHFANWVRQAIADRNTAMAEKQNLNIEMDPDIYREFWDDSI